MPASRIALSFRLAAVFVLALVLAGCTKGGQFDPTEIFNNEMFETKKKIPGDREPVFPDGVPGTTSGVPPDLVKGYQPPPDQAETDTTTPPAPAPVAEAKPKPKPKPKPKLAAAPAQPQQAQDPIWNQKPATAPKRINIGPASKQAAPAAQPATTDTQTAWPSPQQPALSQTAWPAPPPTAQTAQPSQSIWPNPPPPANSSR
jgi:outer membrane biosynthesis protein TonB